jgi:hypothetical protein
MAVMAHCSSVLKVVIDAPPDLQSWWVMRDPAGLLFCVLPIDPGSLNDENGQRWE